MKLTALIEEVITKDQVIELWGKLVDHVKREYVEQLNRFFQEHRGEINSKVLTHPEHISRIEIRRIKDSHWYDFPRPDRVFDRNVTTMINEGPVAFKVMLTLPYMIKSKLELKKIEELLKDHLESPGVDVTILYKKEMDLHSLHAEKDKLHQSTEDRMRETKFFVVIHDKTIGRKEALRILRGGGNAGPRRWLSDN